MHFNTHARVPWWPFGEIKLRREGKLPFNFEILFWHWLQLLLGSFFPCLDILLGLLLELQDVSKSQPLLLVLSILIKF